MIWCDWSWISRSSTTSHGRMRADSVGTGSVLKLRKNGSSWKDLLLQAGVLWYAGLFSGSSEQQLWGPWGVTPSHQPAAGDLGNNSNCGKHPTEHRVLAVLTSRSHSRHSPDAQLTKGVLTAQAQCWELQELFWSSLWVYFVQTKTFVYFISSSVQDQTLQVNFAHRPFWF